MIYYFQKKKNFTYNSFSPLSFIIGVTLWHKVKAVIRSLKIISGFLLIYNFFLPFLSLYFFKTYSKSDKGPLEISHYYLTFSEISLISSWLKLPFSRVNLLKIISF